jgi:membrane-associated progesterone receptor component
MAFSFELGTPINTALFLYILYAVQRIIFPSKSKPTTIPNEFKAGYSWMPKSHPPTVMYRTYTPKTLQPFSGLDGGRILLAINGIVFDVTAGKNFYGPSAYYHLFLRQTLPLPPLLILE